MGEGSTTVSSDFLQRYTFDWDALEIVIGGKSAIDSKAGLPIRSQEDIFKFSDCYGYDLENPIEKAELFGNFQESISFIKRYFLKPDNPDGLSVEFPRKILEITDIQQLLAMAPSMLQLNQHRSQAQTYQSIWACAVLKIMHTISHLDKDLRTSYFSEIQKQILDRFYRYIHSDENGKVYLGKDSKDPERIDLVLFDSKPKKKRDSLILKLLQKPENVAEDIFDRIGIRFVTENHFDALRVVRFLKDRYIIMPANIKPSRSRNTMFRLSEFRVQLEKFLHQVEEGKLKASDLDKKIAAVLTAKSPQKKSSQSNEDQKNPHSSKHHESIQFTSRQLVKFRNPLFNDIKELKQVSQNAAVPEKIQSIVEKLDLGKLQKEIRFFYPFEVQIYDEKSFTESQTGKSAHDTYKKNQLDTVMKRVLGPLMENAKARNR